MKLNTEAEVALHLQMPGMEITLQRNGANDWQMDIQSLVSAETKTFKLTDVEAAATMALIVADDSFQAGMADELYDLVSQELKDAGDFRPIP